MTKRWNIIRALYPEDSLFKQLMRFIGISFKPIKTKYTATQTYQALLKDKSCYSIFLTENETKINRP